MILWSKILSRSKLIQSLRSPISAEHSTKQLVQLRSFEQDISGATPWSASMWAAWLGTRSLRILVSQWWLPCFLGDDEWSSKYFHPQNWLWVYATWAGEPVFLHGEIQSIQYHSLSRGREWSSAYTEVLVCLSSNEQWNHHHLSRQARGQWSLTEEVLATKVKEWAVVLKHFYLPHAWHRKKHDYKQNVLTLYCQKPIFCYSHSDRITCRLLSVEELSMGKSLIKHKVMCIFPLRLKTQKCQTNLRRCSGRDSQTFATGLYLLFKLYLLFAISTFTQLNFSTTSVLIEHFLCIYKYWKYYTCITSV